MTTAERTHINRALGPEVIWASDRAEAQPEPAAWRALALAVTCAAGALMIGDRRAASMVALRSGVSVRVLLGKLYGVTAAPEWDATGERRAFLRTLRFARLRAVN